MGTNIRPELSRRSTHYMNKHRYYELKHFCLQYPLWQKEAANLLTKILVASERNPRTSQGGIFDPVHQAVVARESYLRRIELVETSAKEADESISNYILLGVTEGLSYPVMLARYHLPAGKDYYYDAYRQFFDVLDEKLSRIWQTV